MVYDDAEKLYAEVQADGRDMLEEAFKVLFPESVRLSRINDLTHLDQIAAINTTFFPRLEVIEIPLESASLSLKSQLIQSSKDGKIGYLLMQCQAGERLALSKALQLSSGLTPVTGKLGVHSALILGLISAKVYTNGSDHFVLRNATVQLTISDGRISSLYDIELG
jgi:alpha-mannosidase